jgi:hypothetical protein
MSVHLYGNRQIVTDDGFWHTMPLHDGDTIESFDKRLASRKWRADLISSRIFMVGSAALFTFVWMAVMFASGELQRRVVQQHKNLVILVLSHIPPSWKRCYIQIALLFGFLALMVAIACVTFVCMFNIIDVLSGKWKRLMEQANCFLTDYQKARTLLSECAANPTNDWKNTQAKRLFAIALAQRNRINYPHNALPKFTRSQIFEPHLIPVIAQYL